MRAFHGGPARRWALQRFVRSCVCRVRSRVEARCPSLRLPSCVLVLLLAMLRLCCLPTNACDASWSSFAPAWLLCVLCRWLAALSPAMLLGLALIAWYCSFRLAFLSVVRECLAPSSGLLVRCRPSKRDAHAHRLSSHCRCSWLTQGTAHVARVSHTARDILWRWHAPGYLSEALLIGSICVLRRLSCLCDVCWVLALSACVRFAARSADTASH